MSEGGILVYAEYIEDRVHPVTYELIGKGRELTSKLGGSVKSVIIGYGASSRAEELIHYGADEVYVYECKIKSPLNILLHKEILVSLIHEIKPKLVLFGATPWGRSLAPRVAAALRTGLTADCLDVYVTDDGSVVQVRPAFTGNIIAHIKTVTTPVMTTVRYKVFKPPKKDPSRKGKVIIREVPAEGAVHYAGIEILGKAREKEVNIADAEVIVAGGKGLKRKEDLKLLEELAELLGGVLAVSRPLVDAGWASKDRQVGFSGNVVKPRVYIACGISGSPQHLAGMKDSKVIIAVNIDPSAPIAKYSDLFVIGDLYEVVPKLIEEIRRIRGSKSWRLSPS